MMSICIISKLPRVIHCKELPQWVIESNTACYHPYSNTIYIRNDKGKLTLIHEYLHWFFCIIHFDIGHKLIDIQRRNYVVL